MPIFNFADLKKKPIPDEIPTIIESIVPGGVKILLKYIDKYITREWGPKSDGSIRYDSKYALWLAFKSWFKELSENSEKVEYSKENDNQLNIKISSLINRFDKFEEKVTYIKNIKDNLTKIKERRIKEAIFQKIIIKFPIIIEPNLKFLAREYPLGDSRNRGDILYLDSNNKKLNVELKVTTQSYKQFENQLLNNYIKNIDMDKERIIYITPKLTPEQKEFCAKYNVEWKEININI